LRRPARRASLASASDHAGADVKFEEGRKGPDLQRAVPDGASGRCTARQAAMKQLHPRGARGLSRNGILLRGQQW
jgi:hypothetical protein